MKDERGCYYHPQPGNPGVRVYVRGDERGGVQFRLWQADLPEVWEKHEWIDLNVIRAAAAMYRERGTAPVGGDPLQLYDEAVARALLRER